MRQLLPPPLPDGPSDAVAAVHVEVERPAPAGRPWVLANMVASADGSTVVAGRAHPLSGAADKALFRTLRSVADVVVVGAGTVRAESYGPVRGPDPAAIAVVTRSLELDWGGRLFSEPAARSLVLTCTAADEGHRRRAAEVADVVVAGDEAVDLTAALAELYARGHRVALCEGGPTVLGELAAAGLLDELCLTVSPRLAGGAGPRILHGPDLDPLAPLLLAGALEEDGFLFLRYVRG